MGESEAEQSFFKKHWVGFKDFWAERFSFLENYSRFVNRDEPLPSWSSSDVEQFIASDPIHGPTLKTARQAVSFAITGSVIGAASTAGVAWKYSKSPHGTALSLGAGAVFGFTFGQEVASHWYQLYRLDTMAAQRQLSSPLTVVTTLMYLLIFLLTTESPSSYFRMSLRLQQVQLWRSDKNDRVQKPLSSLLTGHCLCSHLSSPIVYILSSLSTRHVLRRRSPPLAHHVPVIGEASHGFLLTTESPRNYFQSLCVFNRWHSEGRNICA
ncbi:hypothetical protein QYF36_003419 [Acer negundo]|nr:hypothetical protein QYF36_003419 [Acer negundo]